MIRAIPVALAARNRARADGVAGSARRARSATASISAGFAGVEARGGGFGQHRHRLLRSGRGAAAAVRIAWPRITGPRRSAMLAGELIDLDQQAAGRRSRARPRRAAPPPGRPRPREPRRPRPPASSSRRAPLRIGRAAPRARTRPPRSRRRCDRALRAPACSSAADGRLVGSDRRGGQVPGAAVDVAVGQGGGERAVRLAALRGGRVGVDRRAHQRMAELDRAGAERHQAGALGGAQRRDLEPERARPRARAPPDRRCRWSRPAPAHAARASSSRLRPAQERAGDPRRDEHRRALGASAVVGRRRRARAAPAGCRRSPRAAAARRPASSSRSSSRRPRRWLSPSSRSVGRSAPSSSDGSPSRTAISTAIGSATSRRNGEQQRLGARTRRASGRRRSAPASGACSA